MSVVLQNECIRGSLILLVCIDCFKVKNSENFENLKFFKTKFDEGSDLIFLINKQFD